MFVEFVVMEDIEWEVLEREDEWIEKVNREDDDDDILRVGVIWRFFNGC